MKKTFEFTEQEAELLRKEQYKYLINDNIDHFLLLVQQIISERITPEPGESGQSAEEIIRPDCYHEDPLSPVLVITKEHALQAMTIYASQVCADKEREMGLLKNELAKAKEEIEKSHMDKIYSIHDLKSELSAANESLTVMVRKNAELLESVRPDVVVPSEKEVKSDLIYHSYLDGKNKGWNECLSELRRLNPTMTFTELNHEK